MYHCVYFAFNAPGFPTYAYQMKIFILIGKGLKLMYRYIREIDGINTTLALKGNAYIIFRNTHDLPYSLEAHKLSGTFDFRSVFFCNTFSRALHAKWSFRSLGALFALSYSSEQRCCFVSKLRMFHPLRVRLGSLQRKLHRAVRKIAEKKLQASRIQK